MRINKYLAHCGLASRRKCESIILDGRITINNEIITDLSFTVKENDTVEIDGNRINIPHNQEYYILHKPKGYICSSSDELGRKDITSLIKTKKSEFNSLGQTKLFFKDDVLDETEKIIPEIKK